MEQPVVRLPDVSALVQPVREVTVSHKCLCVLLHEETFLVNAETGRREVRTMRDACCGTSFNPDSPLCDPCIYAEHESMPHISYTEVQASRREHRSPRIE